MQFQTEDIVILFFLQKYNFLTISQAARVAPHRHRVTIAKRLLTMQQMGYIDYFGDTRIGFERVPKVYYIKEKGYELLLDNQLEPVMLGNFKKKNSPSWSPIFKHRLQLVDVFLSLEMSIKNYPDLELVKVFMDYNHTPEGKCETTDFVSNEQTPENKIVPDGAFVLRNDRKDTAALYFIELDKGTESIISKIAPNDRQNTIYAKMKKYDRYLTSGNFNQKYSPYGDFPVFTLLFITTSPTRIENIRKKVLALPKNLHQYYLFGTYEEVKDDFFTESWKIRDVEDIEGHTVI